jgi:peptide/nickel transport system substrate-binding protein
MTRPRIHHLAALASLAVLAFAVPLGGAQPTAANDTVVVAQGVDPTTMDPHQQRETTTVNVLRHIYDSLVARNAKNPTKFDGILATHWKRIGAKTMRFTLRHGVTFSNGAAFDAPTVKYNVDRVLGKLPKTKPALISYQFGTVKAARVVNRFTVDIVTKQPDPLILSRMESLMIIPNHSVDADQDALAAKPIGTGPYTLVTWDRNNQVVLKARNDYFRGRPRIANVIFKTMPDAASRLAAIQAGDVDVITNVPPDNVGDVKSSGKATVRTVPSARVASVWLDTLSVAPLKSAKVREALNYAVDTRTIVAKVMSGYGLPVATFVPPYFAGYDRSLKPHPYNPTKAKQLLAQAGYPDGFELTLMVPRGRYLLAEEIVQAVAGYLDKVGVKTKIDAVEFGVFAKVTQTRKIPAAFYAAWGENFFNPIDELQVAVVSGTTGFSWYSNKTVDRLTAKAAATLDQRKQDALIRKIQRIIYKDPPFIYLFAYKDLYGVSTRLHWKPRSDELIYLYDAAVG